MTWEPYPPHGDLETGLGIWTYTHPDSTVSLDTGFAHGGANSLKVVAGADTQYIGARIELGAGHDEWQLVPATPGPITGWYYTTDTAIATVSMFVDFVESGNYFEFVAPAVYGAWTQLTLTYDFDPADVSFEFVVLGRSSSYDGGPDVLPAGAAMWWDDFDWPAEAAPVAPGWYVGHPMTGVPPVVL